ncbi:MAG: type II toxin-antitoxin system VapC family toxin [Bdellovibrionales bacterium]|nr:type II toxin-antitoxin system VapC family toxin [Bdellovibrionales bacterium]
MKYLLDTNALIHLFQAKEPINSKVRSCEPGDICISGFTEAEILYGVENSSPEFREQNRIARALGMQPFQRIYHDSNVSIEYGRIKAHLNKNNIYFPSNELDIFIAATAIAKNLVLITQNIRDFDAIPNLTIENWSQ